MELRKPFFLTLALVVGSAMVPAQALAVRAIPQPKVVAVSSCGLDTNAQQAPEEALSAPPPLVDGIDVRFTNVSDKPISNIVFALTYNGQERLYTDAGVFSPGAAIAHVLYSPQEAYSAPAQGCQVVGVTFADGTQWAAAGSATDVAAARP